MATLGTLAVLQFVSCTLLGGNLQEQYGTGNRNYRELEAYFRHSGDRNLGTVYRYIQGTNSSHSSIRYTDFFSSSTLAYAVLEVGSLLGIVTCGYDILSSSQKECLPLLTFKTMTSSKVLAWGRPSISGR